MKYLVFILLFCCIALHPSFALNQIPPGNVAPDLSLPDQQGKIHNLRTYRGKFVLVNFWTVDCRHCREDITQLELAYRHLQSLGLEVIIVNAGNSVADVKKMIELNPVSYTVLLDLDLTMGTWGIPVVPTAYLVNPEGQRIYRTVGPQKWSSPAMIKKLQSILTKDD